MVLKLNMRKLGKALDKPSRAIEEVSQVAEKLGAKRTLLDVSWARQHYIFDVVVFNTYVPRSLFETLQG